MVLGYLREHQGAKRLGDSDPKDIVPLDQDTLDRLEELWDNPLVEEIRERFLPAPIPNDKLTPDLIPTRTSSLDEIWRFALTFQGYEEWGSFELCADIANSRLNSSLSELRTCLFFEQRRWNHLRIEPDDDMMEYLYALVEGIRKKVEEGETAGTA